LRLVKMLDAEEVGADARFADNAARIANRAQLIPLLQQRFDTRPRDTWLAQLKQSDIPAAAIQDVGEALNDPQTRARGLVVALEHPSLGTARSIANPIRLQNQPLQYRLPPPLLGEHTAAILRQLQYSEEDIVRAVQDACAVL